MNNKINDLIEYAVNSFSFLLPMNGEFTFEEWANEIREAYDEVNPKTNMVVRAIEGVNGSVIRSYGTTEIVIN